MFIGKRSLILIFLAFAVVVSSYSQRRRRKGIDVWEGFQIAPMAGLNAFYGDLVDESRASYSLSVAFEREMTPFLNLRAQIGGGKMQGTQMSNDSTEFAKFKNVYVDFGIGATFKPLDLTLGYFRQRFINPYVIAQLGINYYNSEEEYGLPYLQTSQPEKFLLRPASGITPNISAGAGLALWINPAIKLRVEALANKPFSDYLDSHEYWINDAGENIYSDGQDFYYTIMAGATFTIKDSRWKNEPKYNRKAYLKTRRYNLYQPKTRKKYKPRKRR